MPRSHPCAPTRRPAIRPSPPRRARSPSRNPRSVRRNATCRGAEAPSTCRCAARSTTPSRRCARRTTPSTRTLRQPPLTRPTPARSPTASWLLPFSRLPAAGDAERATTVPSPDPHSATSSCGPRSSRSLAPDTRADATATTTVSTTSTAAPVPPDPAGPLLPVPVPTGAEASEGPRPRATVPTGAEALAEPRPRATDPTGDSTQDDLSLRSFLSSRPTHEARDVLHVRASRCPTPRKT